MSIYLSISWHVIKKYFSFTLWLLIFVDVSNNSSANIQNYGRIYNVEDFITHSENDLVGINRCLTNMYFTLLNSVEKNPGKKASNHVYTIIFPKRTYRINQAMSPVTIVNGEKVLQFVRKMDVDVRNIKVTIHLVGITLDPLSFQKNLIKHTGNRTTCSKSDFSRDQNTQSYWLPNQFLENGIDISQNRNMNLLIHSNLASTRMRTNGNPASSNFLSYQTTNMPEIISNDPITHNFFYFKTNGLGSTEAWIYPPSPNKLMHETHLIIRGLKLKGMSSESNSHIYAKHSTQHNKTFAMGTGIHVEAFKNVKITNMVLENMYGTGILVHNRFYAYKNGYCNVDSNVLLNVWGLKYKRVCKDGSYDDSGYTINFTGIKGGTSNFNYIKNDLAITKQNGSIALATCCENDMDCEAAYNQLSGYDRLIHVENGLGGFKIHHNRLTGSETGLVFDGNRDYKGVYCPPANPCDVSYNYISNEGIQHNPDLQKLYPPFLLFSPSAHRSNEYHGTSIRNNTFVIDKASIFNYSDNNSSECSNGDPRSHKFEKNVTRFHIRSGIRAQKIMNNKFIVTNKNTVKPFAVGGTCLYSYCPDEIVDPNPCPVKAGDFNCNWASNKTDNRSLFTNTLPVTLMDNQFVDCEELYIIHHHSSLKTIKRNKFNVSPKNTNSVSLSEYTKE